MAPPLIQLKDIKLTFGGTPLLSGVELSVSSGERVCLIGRNGSGKSTLLKIAAGLVQPDSGSRFVQPGATIRYLPQEPDDFLAMMAAQPDLALLLRPSLQMRFQRLWMTDKTALWDLTFQLCANEALPALLQSCSLAIVAQNAKTSDDVKLLAEQLRQEPANQTLGSAGAYRHLVGVLVAGGSDNQPDLGAEAGYRIIVAHGHDLVRIDPGAPAASVTASVDLDPAS